MKTLYIECGMGVAGDMLSASLLELVDKQKILLQINEIFKNKAIIKAESSMKCCILGTHISVEIGGHTEEEHHHSTMQSISCDIEELDISQEIKDRAIAVYNMIAQAESKVHNTTVDKIHFHEVGEIDAIVDIVFSMLLIAEIKPERIVVSPIAVGSGYVKCQHGILPVPAPATAEILMGVPTYNDGIKGELCTPTGASLVKYLADSFGDMPKMTVSKVGYGMGTKDFERANCVRVYLGESAEQESKASCVIEIQFNVDDMTGEDVAYATKELLAQGAREVFSVAVMGKKSRMGQLITVICSQGEEDKFIDAIFKHTSTIGVRYSSKMRKMLERELKTFKSKFGDIRYKVSGYSDTQKCKIEFDDLERLANKTGLAISTLRSEIEREIEEQKI